MQGSTVHSIKKFHRNFEAAAAVSADGQVVAAAVETDSVTAKDEFWDYERQVCEDILFIILLQLTIP